MKKSELGIVGVGVMGQGVSLNFARNGYDVSIYDIDEKKVTVFSEGKAAGIKEIVSYNNLSDFVESLNHPRRILLFVQAGQVTDNVIEQLLPLIEKNDLIVDFGNSHYKDTERRNDYLSAKGINYLGIGISGGEKGALTGPSIMAGGSRDAWESIRHMLESISAIHPEGGYCCGYFGKGGAGHFVKMVHNGIEYAYMGVISELYLICKDLYNLPIDSVAGIFETLAEDSRVSSYLVEITGRILRRKDTFTDNYLIEMISDVAGNKGTGLWTSEAALNLSVAAPTLTAALYMRYISNIVRLGVYRSMQNFDKQESQETEDMLVNKIRSVLEFCQYIFFEQGINIINTASKRYGWDIDSEEVLRVWDNGSIIRTAYSGVMKKAQQKKAGNQSMLFDIGIQKIIEASYNDICEVVCQTVQNRIPILCISSCLDYYNSIITEVLPTVMVQAQRDFFGAHTYKRIDRSGTYHTEWEEEA